MSVQTPQADNNFNLTNPTVNNSNTVATMTTASGHAVQKAGDNSYWDTVSSAFVSNDAVIGKAATCSGGN